MKKKTALLLAYLFFWTILPVWPVHAVPVIKDLIVKESPWVDVRAGFSGADDGIKWNNARASIPANGGTIFVPPGSYNLTTPFTYGGQNNVVLYLSPGVTLSGSALPSPTGNNAIIDLRRDQSTTIKIIADTWAMSGGAIQIENSGNVADANYAGGKWVFGEITDAAWDDETIEGQTASGTNWTTPSNALADDANYAVYNTTTQDWLKISNFGLFVPAEALGIRVSIKGYGTGATDASRTIKVGLSKDNANTIGDIKTVVLNKDSATQVTVGGGTALWGTTWSAAELNSSNFSVFIADNDVTASEIDIGLVRVTIVYNSGVSIFEVRNLPAGAYPLTIGSNGVTGVLESYVAKGDVGTDQSFRPTLLVGSRNGQSYIRLLGDGNGGGIIVDATTNLSKSRTGRGAYFGANASGQIRLYALSAMTSAEMTAARSAAENGLTIDTDNKIKIGANGTGISKHLSATASLDFTSIAANTTAGLDVAVTGATAGDTVSISPSGAPENGLVWSGFVGLDNVTVRLGNVTGGAIDPAARTWRVDVWKH